MEVRAGFGAKVRKTVLLLNAAPGMVQRASKYAAMLPLAGMDPNEPNRCLWALFCFAVSRSLGGAALLNARNRSQAIWL